MDGKYTLSHIKIENYHKEIQMRNITECLKENARIKPDIEGVIFISTDDRRQSVTWSELYERSIAAARSMLKLGVKRNEIVAVNVRSCPEWLYATFGAMIAGAIPVSISFTYTDGSDLVAMMEKLKCCSLLVMDPGHDDVNWNIMLSQLDEFNANGEVRSTKLTYLRYLVGVNFDSCPAAVKNFQDLLQDDNTNIGLPDIAPEDVAMMFQTSGSTGEQKLVVHTHASLISLTGSNLITFDDRYLLFNDRPFNWIGGYPFSAFVGQSRVTISEFSEAPKDRVAFMKEVIQRERCNLVAALPPLMMELMKIKDELPPDWPVQGVLSGGQPITKSLTDCIGKVGQFFMAAYGTSESMFLTQAYVTDARNFAEYGCGKPLKIKGLEMKVVDENGKTVPVNTRGEVYARSPECSRDI